MGFMVSPYRFSGGVVVLDACRFRCIDSNGTNDAFGVRELEMYASTDGTGTNLATLTGGNVAIASYDNASFPKENAFNGNTGDFWTSLGTAPPAGGHWIGVQFASPTSIGSLRVNTRGEFNESPQSYAIDFLIGGVWTVEQTGGAITGNTWVVLPT